MWNWLTFRHDSVWIKLCGTFLYRKKYNDLPYREDYKSYNNAPIATIATAWQSPETVEFYNMVFNESSWTVKLMKNVLINPNQIQHYHVNVQYDPTSRRPLSIITDNVDFNMDLHRKGIFLYFNSNIPTNNEL